MILDVYAEEAASIASSYSNSNSSSGYSGSGSVSYGAMKSAGPDYGSLPIALDGAGNDDELTTSIRSTATVSALKRSGSSTETRRGDASSLLLPRGLKGS